MRCPDCNKFVGYDDPEIEVNSVEVEGDHVTCELEVSLNCSECGTTLKSATAYDVTCTIEFPDEYPIEDRGCSSGDGHSWQCDDLDAEGEARGGGSSRAYGATLEGDATCEHCEKVARVSGEAFVPAGEFEEQV